MPYPWGERVWVIDTKKRLYGCNMVYSVVYLNKSFHFELLRWPSFWGKWGRQLYWRRLLSLNWHGRWQKIKWKQNVCCSSVWPPWYWRFRTLVLGVPCWLCCSTWEEGKLLPSLCWSNHKLSQGQQAHNAEVLQQTEADTNNPISSCLAVNRDCSKLCALKWIWIDCKQCLHLNFRAPFKVLCTCGIASLHATAYRTNS